MTEIVYIRMKKHIKLSALKSIKLKDIAYIAATGSKWDQHKLKNEHIYQITEKDSNYLVLDGFLVIKYLLSSYPGIEVQLAGPSQCIIQIEKKRRSMPIWVVACVWIILFVGAAMTIMNFHYDVSMQAVQQRLHYLLTGKANKFPLWIQIPYSIGLGLGMLLFFNHWFKRKFNEEPSPLEVEIFKYQESLDSYIIHHENTLNDSEHSR